MKDIVSIIIPIHNSEKYLKKCLDSILNQTYESIEIICIENGSTDNSLEILKTYKNKIKLYTLTNPSISEARNKGINASNGKYISFIDSDDFIEPTFIKELVNLIEREHTDLTLCDIKEIHEETQKEKIQKEYPYNKINKEQILNNLHKINHGPCNKLFKKEIIEKNKIYFPPNIKYEDLPFINKYLKNINSISKINKPLYNYNIHKESEQTTINSKIFDIIKSIKMCDNNYMESFITKTLLTYALKTRYTCDKKLRKEFINEVFKELNTNYSNWRKSTYIKETPILKRTIIKHKTLIKIYTFLYKITH